MDAEAVADQEETDDEAAALMSFCGMAAAAALVCSGAPVPLVQALASPDAQQ
jgi:hypothetical protein